ncbi:MAG TPA: hypothetical protein DGT21_21325 [Armatimonadetes bacterium]|nr:hypothetical protein [Armatimonadota bacterium]
MLVFLATILVNLSFALLVRAAQRRGVDVVASGIVNYLFAAATYWIAVLVTGTPYAPEAPRIGLAAGVFYVSTYLLLLPAMRIRGVAIAMGFVRLSVVIPLIAAVIVWHEAPGPVKQAGIVLALLALPMLSLDGGANSAPLTRRNLVILLGLFLTNGTCLLMGKWFQSTGLVAERPLYLAIVYSTAALVFIAALPLLPKARFGAAELRWGALIGLCNCAANILMLYTLDLFLASVVFPIIAAVNLSLATIFAAVTWREIPGRLGWTGICVAVLAVILANT